MATDEETLWAASLAGKRVVVVGLGRSGVAAAQLALDHGARVTATDSRTGEQLGEALYSLRGRAELELGAHRLESFTRAELIIVSPGVPSIPELEAAREGGVPILGEIELATRFVTAPIVGITGTNGKSTTTSLVGEMLAASGFSTFCGGNLGRPLAAAVGDTALSGPAGRVVLELSSFQLETVARFHARVAVLLNLTEDHLDRYPSFAAYEAAKARIFERQTCDDVAVINGEPDQARCRELARASGAPTLTFSLERPSSGEGAWSDGDAFVVHLPGEAIERYPRRLLSLAGRHNAQNCLAALLAARSAGATPAGCRRAMAHFRALPHRMEFVEEIDGVRFFDDSKATNVGSVVGSLAGFEQPVVLIAGGKDKGGAYEPLIPVIRSVCRHVVLIGAAAERIARALDGVAPLHRAASLPEAVRLARELARRGDAVILSPACSSFDMFRDYEERGALFAEAVRMLPR